VVEIPLIKAVAEAVLRQAPVTQALDAVGSNQPVSSIQGFAQRADQFALPNALQARDHLLWKDLSQIHSGTPPPKQSLRFLFAADRMQFDKLRPGM
jgi:hypothetical protein